MSRYLRATRGTPGKVNAEGLEPIRLGLWQDGKEVDHVTCYTGAPGCQNFRTLANEVRGQNEPIPEGRYTNLGEPEWAGRRGDWETYWSPALGPVVVRLYGARAIELHLDANRFHGAPGSAGCLCPIDLPGIKKAIGWFEAGEIDFLEVDWGLGTIHHTGAMAARDFRVVKAHGRPDLGRLRVNGEDTAGEIVLRFSRGGGWSASMDGKPIKPASLELVMKLNK